MRKERLLRAVTAGIVAGGFMGAPQSVEGNTTPLKRQSITLEAESMYINQINIYRAAHGLKPIHINLEVCKFADVRAQEISTNFSHEGFEIRAQNETLPYKNFSIATENIEYNVDPTTVVDAWINSPPHAAALRANTYYGCVGKYGDYYAYEGMDPLTPPYTIVAGKEPKMHLKKYPKRSAEQFRRIHSHLKKRTKLKLRKPIYSKHRSMVSAVFDQLSGA